MIPYYILIIVIVLCTIFWSIAKPQTIKTDKNYLKIVFLILIIFSASRSIETCVDNYWYNEIFQYSKEKTFVELISYGDIEIGYEYLNKIISLLGGDLGILYSIISTVYLLSFHYVIKKYSKNYITSIFIFICFEFFIISFGLLRQSLAMAFLVFAIDAVLEKKPIKFVLLIIGGFMFHKTAILFLPAYLINYIKLDRKTIVIFSITAIIVLFFGKEIVNLVINNIFTPIGYIDEHEKSGYIFLLMQTIFVGISTFMLKGARESSIEKKSLKIILLSILFQSLATNYSTLHRITIEYMMPLIILIPNEIESHFKHKKLKLINTITIVIFLSFFAYSIVYDTDNFQEYMLSSIWVQQLISSMLCIMILKLNSKITARGHIIDNKPNNGILP